MISFQEFQKIDLRVAKIAEVEDIPGKDKLYKIKIDLGDEQKQIVAGIKPFYTKDNLIGKNVVVVANLEPATIAGVKSECMLLAAKDVNGNYTLVTVESEVKPGTKVE
ncbi:MAG: methionine--tRNA ligase subunit beta [Candidatus Diapherotrites archaeon]|nr:methionine--tRNA ligase subunit beta [Candidatus Diapherotrites archaeon]